MTEQEKIRRLASPEFNKILAADPVLRDLRAAHGDNAVAKAVLLEVLGCAGLRIGALRILPLTAAKWAFLWMLDNPLVIGGAVRETDTDQALYILTLPDLRKLDCSLEELPAAASGYAKATGLSPEQLPGEIAAVFRWAFSPLRELPEGSKASGPPKFDAAWATRICGVAARESGEPFARCLHDLPLSTICCFFAGYVLRECTPGTVRPADPDRLEAMAARVDELAEEYLRESGSA